MNNSLPTIPTDNLYKFSAITGTILFILGLSIQPFIWVKLEIKVHNLSKIQRLNHVTDSLKYISIKNKIKTYDLVDSIEDNIRDLKFKLTLKKNRSDSLLLKLNEIFSKAERTLYRLNRDDSMLSSISITNNYNRHKTDYSFLYLITTTKNIILIISLILTLGGFGLGQWGFKNWYEKLQKPLDQERAQKLKKRNFY